MNKLDRLYNELRDNYKAKEEILKKIGALEGEECTARFSLCLDCRYINACPRYEKHRKEMP